MISYDPRGHTWDSWCRLMDEMFAQQQLGIVPEDQWRDWADGMNGVGYFVDYGIPTHHGFNDWRDWASRLVGIINVRQR